MIQVIERFHRILEYLAENPERPAQLGELAECLGVSAPACSNIVKTMVELGYLHSLGKRRGYRLGPAFYLLGGRNPYRYLVDVARPEIEALATELDIFVVLVAECGGKRQELLRMSGDSTISIQNRENSFTKLFRCATGTVLLAHMEPARLKSLWEHGDGAGNSLGLADFAAFSRKLGEIAEAGEVVFNPKTDYDPADPDANATMAVPIRQGGSVVAALGIRVGLHQKIPLDKALDGCRRCAGRINQLMRNQSDR